LLISVLLEQRCHLLQASVVEFPDHFHCLQDQGFDLRWESSWPVTRRVGSVHDVLHFSFKLLPISGVPAAGGVGVEAAGCIRFMMTAVGKGAVVPWGKS